MDLVKLKQVHCLIIQRLAQVNEPWPVNIRSIMIQNKSFVSQIKVKNSSDFEIMGYFFPLKSQVHVLYTLHLSIIQLFGRLHCNTNI